MGTPLRRSRRRRRRSKKSAIRPTSYGAIDSE